MLSKNLLEKPAADPRLWMLDRDIIFLNHGSFGSCPKAVLEFQNQIRTQMEQEPVQFFVRDLEPLLDEARTEIAHFLDGIPEQLVFVPNATYGVNCVLNSLSFKLGDEILITNHEYNACKNAVNVVAEKSGAKVVVARIPFPLKRTDEISASIFSSVTERTKLIMIDHVTSPTGLAFPVEEIVKKAKTTGIPVLIDGAHTAGMLPLSLKKLDADFYTGNCHKWLCSPKGSAFLYVKKQWIDKIRPIAISHGANSPRTDRSRYLIEFGWTGTHDPSPYLSVPMAIKYLESLVDGGWQTIMARNRALALAARNMICTHLEIEPPAPDDMIGSMAAFRIWNSSINEPPKTALYSDALQNKLMEKYKIEVPVAPWENYPQRTLRISAQLYNYLEQYEILAKALKELRNKNY
ncbi:MAG: aminotransferase class V-fold PLP-dependent enzyme [Verrucomicrobiae bacterium]|nr:aminotransferase class V-fold PLP-dependent enzyme [Verrucomicrobiae bacterium]